MSLLFLRRPILGSNLQPLDWTWNVWLVLDDLKSRVLLDSRPLSSQIRTLWFSICSPYQSPILAFQSCLGLFLLNCLNPCDLWSSHEFFCGSKLLIPFLIDLVIGLTPGTLLGRLPSPFMSYKSKSVRPKLYFHPGGLGNPLTYVFRCLSFNGFFYGLFFRCWSGLHMNTYSYPLPFYSLGWPLRSTVLLVTLP